MKQLLFYFLCLFSIGVTANPAADYLKANELYKAGKFAEAAKKYEAVLLSGNEAAEVYFNLGNAFFKQKNMPQAILNYERAARLSPGDADIQFNIRIANARIVDKIEVMPEIFYSRWASELRNTFSADGWAKVSILFAVIALLSSIIYLLTRNDVAQRTAFFVSVLSIIILISALAFGYSQFNQLQEAKTAIIFTPTLNVKSSPSENGTNIFVVHEGTKVNLEDRVGTWVKIRLNDGNIGWVEEGSLVVI